jgi:SAM-dependent methyltransferase
MSPADYEYRGLMAKTWDLFRGDTSKWEDRDFYLEIIREKGQPVLDVGCGTGRLLLDFMAQGIDIDGVDNSPEMLALCREKAEAMGLMPKLYKNKMESMRLPRQYQTIIVPSSSFQLVLEPADAQRSILNLFEHLLGGGFLVMPFMQIWKRGEPLESDWQISGEKTRLEDGAIYKRWSKSRFDPETQLEHNEDRYEVIKDGVMIAAEYHVQSPATREYTRQQAIELYTWAGFVDITIYQGITRLPSVEGDPIFSIVGRKL